MIQKLTILDHENTPLTHWSKEPVLLSLKEIAFEPGVNILYGKNKSGKSSILKLLAHFFYAAGESERSNISTLSYRTMYPYVYHNDPQEKHFAVSKSVAIEHDEQGLVYVNYGFRENYYKPMISLDQVFTKYPPKTKIEVLHDNYIQSADREQSETFFKSDLPLGVPTILIDSPDSGMDLTAQFDLWEKLSQVRPEDYQLIIATNSPFALDIPGFNYIELTPGFYATAKQSALAWASTLNGWKPKKMPDMDKVYAMTEYRTGKKEE
jgi:hypothetical protein